MIGLAVLPDVPIKFNTEASMKKRIHKVQRKLSH